MLNSKKYKGKTGNGGVPNVILSKQKATEFPWLFCAKNAGASIANHETQLTELTVLATIKLEKKQ